MVLGGSESRGGRYVANEEVCEEAEGNHRGVRCGSAYIKAVYRGREDGGVYQVPIVVRPRSRPHTGGSGDGVK